MKNAYYLSLSIGLWSCITPTEKKDMQTDIFNVQTRLLTLERQLTDTSKESKNTGDTAGKRLASTRTDVDRMQRDIREIRGEIDALRIGVVTGRLPGATTDDQQGSVAGTLARLTQRLDSIEQTQADILDAITKAGVKKNPNTKKPNGRAAVVSVKDLEGAFEGKRYKQVIDDVPQVLKDSAPGERERLRYLQAESYFKLGDMRVAALKFNELLDSKPAKDLIPTIKMRLGDCFRNLGDADTAKIYYQELIREFPSTDEASKAKERLAELSSAGNTGKG